MDAADPNRWLRRTWTALRYSAKPQRAARFLVYVGRRFWNDDGFGMASGLSYATLLALVPLIVIGLAIFTAFPTFADVRDSLQALIFDTFLPARGEEISERLLRFVDNAQRLTAAGIVAFTLTALLLLSNINAALNRIWRVSEPRPLSLSFLVYWALLTLGPLLIGASLSISGQWISELESVAGRDLSVLAPLSWLLSVGLAAVGFTVLFWIAPNRSIYLRHAFIGGVTAALAFELLKDGFAFYIVRVPSYEAVYGALAAVPIFLIWMYLSWTVVLLGAELTAALPEWRATQARGNRALNAGSRLALALALLERLRDAAESGEQVRRRRLLMGLPATPAEADQIMSKLRSGKFIARTGRGRWLLARDLSKVSLGELLATLGLDLDAGEAWPERAAYITLSLEEDLRLSVDTPLETLFSRAVPAESLAPSPATHAPDAPVLRAEATKRRSGSS